MNGWQVELSKAAKREFRNLESGPQKAAAELIADLAEDPTQVPALGLRGKQHVWRARFHNDHYRMVFQIARASRRILVTRIRIRATAYKNL